MGEGPTAFGIGILTGVILTGAVAYALAPAIASRAAQRATMRLGSDIGLPSELTRQFAIRVGPIVAREVQAVL